MLFDLVGKTGNIMVLKQIFCLTKLKQALHKWLECFMQCSDVFGLTYIFDAHPNGLHSSGGRWCN